MDRRYTVQITVEADVWPGLPNVAPETALACMLARLQQELPTWRVLAKTAVVTDMRHSPTGSCAVCNRATRDQCVPVHERVPVELRPAKGD